MLNKVHHITFVVESIDDMADYIERNFSLSPMIPRRVRGPRLQVHPLPVSASAYVDFFEPLRDDTPMAQQLKATGPGVMHVAFGVDGIDQVFADLVGKGNKMRSDAPAPSPFGYRNLNIDTASSHGILFQLAEGEVSH